MKLNRRRLRRLIKEEYRRVLREMNYKGFQDPNMNRQRDMFDIDVPVLHQGSVTSHASGNNEACIQECLQAIPPMMKQICGMGMSHMVINDIYHICEPICHKHNCDPDEIHEMVMRRLGA
jgi:hypothetical protein